MSHSMKLSRLLYHFYDSTLYSDVEITGLALDSRKVKPGDLFFACKGTKLDGSTFIDEAIKKGARAILEEVSSESVRMRTVDNIPIYPVEHLSQQVGRLAAEFYGNPSQQLSVIGITGTNGKTSTSYFIEQALKVCGIRCGVIGTLGSGISGEMKESTLTTPDAISLQSLLADFVKKRVKVVAMEVSSHSLDQGRVNGIQFAISIFTNLTRDHLDYHQTMENYGAAKQKLFDPSRTQYSVINGDDKFGQQIATSLSPETTYLYSLNKLSLPSARNIYAETIHLTQQGIQAHIESPWGSGELLIPLLGKFNLSNVLASFTALCLLKIPFSEVLQALSALSPVPGRMQTLGGNGQPLVVVDYAHTPDALQQVLTALKYHCEGKLFCLFGCGGDRDRGKRPLMAKIAEQYADHIIVTDDNPRTEDPKKIVEDIVNGFEDSTQVNIEHNRSKAISDIIQYAHSGDCVLIAGKGAETYQQIGIEKYPFSDVEKVMESLNARVAE